MKCPNCHYDFEGKFCPMCGRSADSPASALVPFNPYEATCQKPRKQDLKGWQITLIVLAGTIGPFILIVFMAFAQIFMIASTSHDVTSTYHYSDDEYNYSYEDEYGISPGIRYSDYQSVQNGMLYSQVYDILGPGTCVSSYSDSGSSSTTMTYVWCYTENGENFIITITFQDNVVVNKEHVWHSQS